MGVTAFMRGAIVVTGLFLVAGSIWFHAKKKMTLDRAVAGCLLGIAITLGGAAPLLSRWLGLISIWTGAALLCVGVACLLGAFRICLLISRLITQNQELAMMVAILLAERQGDAAAERKPDHEKNPVCR